MEFRTISRPQFRVRNNGHVYQAGDRAGHVNECPRVPTELWPVGRVMLSALTVSLVWEGGGGGRTGLLRGAAAGREGATCNSRTAPRSGDTLTPRPAPVTR